MPTALALALASLQHDPSPAALLALYTRLAGYPSTLRAPHTAPPASDTASDALRAFEHALEKAPAASDAARALRREYWSERLQAGLVPCACCGSAICVTDARGAVREEKLCAVLDEMFAKEGAPVGWNPVTAPAPAKADEHGSPRRRVKKVRRVRRPRGSDVGSDCSSGSGSAAPSYDPYAPSTSAHCP